MYIACDVETTSLDFTDCELLGLGYWHPKGKAYLTDKQAIYDWLQQHKDDQFIWQNGKYDAKVIAQHLGLKVQNNFDTLLAASLLPNKPESLALDSLVTHYLGLPSWKDKSFITNLKSRSVEEQAAYCLTDCERTYQLKQVLEKELIECGNYPFFMQRLMPLATFLWLAEYRGIRTDYPKLLEMQKKALKDIEDYDAKLYAQIKDLVKEYEDLKIDKHLAKHPKSKMTREELRMKPANRFNPSGDKQRLYLLKDKLGFPCEKTEWERGRKVVKFSAAKPVIKEYVGKHPIIDQILELEDLKTEEESVARYIRFTGKDGKIHTTINLHRADTGRTSSSDPPMQNVKRGEMRTCFIADPGKKLVILDYSQIEFRVAAHYTQDRKMLEAFRAGVDIYAVIANGVQGTDYDPNKMKKEHPEVREFGKVMGLAGAYGLGAEHLAQDIRVKLKIPCDWAQGKKHLDHYFMQFPGLQKGMHDAYLEVLEKGYVDTLMGRKVFVSKKEAQRKAFNYKIQPSASDLLTEAQTWIDKEQQQYGFGAEFLLPVHDEGVWQVDTDKAENFAMLASHVMKNGWRKYAPELNLLLNLDVSVDIGDTWGAKK